MITKKTFSQKTMSLQDKFQVSLNFTMNEITSEFELYGTKLETKVNTLEDKVLKLEMLVAQLL